MYPNREKAQVRADGRKKISRSARLPHRKCQRPKKGHACRLFPLVRSQLFLLRISTGGGESVVVCALRNGPPADREAEEHRG